MMQPSKPPLLENELSTIASLAQIRTKPASFLQGFSDADMLNALLQTASDPSISDNHATRAIRALVSVLQKLRSEADPNLSPLLFGTHDVWFRCLDVLLQRSESTNNKPIRQFLTLLLNLLKVDGAPEIYVVLQRLLEPLKDLTSRAQVKPALQTVTVMLSKKTVPVGMVVEGFSSKKRHEGPGEVEGREKLESVFSELFFWGQYHELTHQVGQLSSLLDSCLGGELKYNSVPWIKPILQRLRNSPDCLLRFKSHIFPALFSGSLDSYHSFLHEAGLEMMSSNDMRRKECDQDILFAALQVGKEIGFVTETGKSHATLQHCVLF
jgi:hypothetical protein